MIATWVSEVIFSPELDFEETVDWSEVILLDLAEPLATD